MYQSVPPHPSRTPWSLSEKSVFHRLFYVEQYNRTQQPAAENRTQWSRSKSHFTTDSNVDQYHYRRQPPSAAELVTTFQSHFLPTVQCQKIPPSTTGYRFWYNSMTTFHRLSNISQYHHQRQPLGADRTRYHFPKVTSQIAQYQSISSHPRRIPWPLSESHFFIDCSMLNRTTAHNSHH